MNLSLTKPKEFFIKFAELLAVVMLHFIQGHFHDLLTNSNLKFTGI